jgi:hypothetical protein
MREAPGREEIDRAFKFKDQVQAEMKARDYSSEAIFGTTFRRVYASFDDFTNRLFERHPDQTQQRIDTMIETAHDEALDLNRRYDDLRGQYQDLSDQAHQLDARITEEGETDELRDEAQRLNRTLDVYEKDLRGVMVRMGMKGTPESRAADERKKAA